MAESGKNILFILTMVAVIIMAWIWSYALSPGPEAATPTVIELVVPPGTSFRGIEKELLAKGLVRPDRRFRLTAALMGLSGSLKSGDYRLRPGLSPYDILKRLALGSIRIQPLTIPEGYNIAQIDQIFAAKGWTKKGMVKKLARDRKFIHSLGLATSSLEGYLFPDTYFFVRGGQSAEEILATMVGQTRQVIRALNIKKQLPRIGLDLHQFMTLASIVEKESGRVTEQPLIARVFLNRLQKRMRLQADPTVIYGIRDFNGNLTRKDLKTPGAYNTYINKGLPPGPICNPGRSAMAATIKPAEGRYLYFVSKNDGSHYFSTSLSQHNRAVAKFQKHRRKTRR